MQPVRIKRVLDRDSVFLKTLFERTNIQNTVDDLDFFNEIDEQWTLISCLFIFQVICPISVQGQLKSSFSPISAVVNIRLGTITNNAIIILVLLLLFTGIYFGCTGKKQKTAREFLMADRSMSIVPVSMSMLARYDPCCVPNSYWPECSDINEVEEVVPTCHHYPSSLVIDTSCIRNGVQTLKCIWLMNMWPNV